jgi:hypothetical protein
LAAIAVFLRQCGGLGEQVGCAGVVTPESGHDAELGQGSGAAGPVAHRCGQGQAFLEQRRRPRQIARIAGTPPQFEDDLEDTRLIPDVAEMCQRFFVESDSRRVIAL